MQILKNRTVAWVIFALVALSSIGISGRGSLLAAKNAAENVYYHGANNDELCIDYDLKQASEAAKSLAAISQANGIETTLSEKASTVLSTADKSDRYLAYTEMTEAFYAAYAALGNLKLEDSVSKKVSGLYAEYRSRENTIEHDPYNAAADAFNADLSTFPKNLVSVLGGVGKLEAFR